MTKPIPDDLQEFLQSDDLKGYLSDGYPKWLPRFTNLLQKRPKIGGVRSAFSWNWAAFLVALIFPPGWFFLNRAWTMGWFLLVVCLLAAFTWPHGGLLMLIALIFAGREANNSKLVVAHRAVTKAQQAHSEEGMRRTALQSAGKNAWGAFWGALAIYVLVAGMVAVAQDIAENPDAYATAGNESSSSASFQSRNPWYTACAIYYFAHLGYERDELTSRGASRRALDRPTGGRYLRDGQQVYRITLRLTEQGRRRHPGREEATCSMYEDPNTGRIRSAY